MTEQEMTNTTSEDAMTTVEHETKKRAKTIASKTAKRPTKKAVRKIDTKTDDQKRLARNAALREWRKKNADRVKAYMTEWRAKRKGTESGPPTGEVLHTATNNGAVTAKKRSSSKKSKKSKSGGKA